MTHQWPLPELPHVPGKTARPESSPAFDAAAAAPIYTVDRMWRENDTYLYGLELYAAGYFWEAHEVWEPVWMRSPGNSRERLVIQGLIQLSNACLKIVMGRPEAALRLLEIARQKVTEASHAGPEMMGVLLEPLTQAIRTFEHSVEANPRQNPEKLLKRRPALTVDLQEPATPV